MPYDSVADLPANVKKKPAKTQRQWMHVWNSSFQACMSRDEGDTAKCETEAFKRANGVIKGGEMPDGQQLIQMSEIKLEKTDPSVMYRDGGTEDASCGNCRFYYWRQCCLVEGTIEPSYQCNMWREQLPSQSQPSLVYSESEDARIFMDVAALFKDIKKGSKEWIPFLPKPGKYQHAEYGEVEVTEASNQQLIDSINNKIYQEHIPLDAEHETKLSGAVAWIKEGRVNDDGSGDVYVEWSDRGAKLVNGDQYRYISPEWFHSWTDPATGEVHEHVVAGGAITTRPFFKDKVLRALVASEAGSSIVAAEEFAMHKCKGCGKMFSGDKCPECGETYKEATVPSGKGDAPPITFTEEQQAEIDRRIAAAKEGLFTEDQVKEREEAAKKASEPAEGAPTAAQFTEIQGKLEEESKARQAAEARVTTLEKANRHQRFTDLVAGKGGSGDGAPWVGDQAKHVEFLETLADSVGEESEAFKTHVELSKAAAEQLKEGETFREIGTGYQPPVETAGSDKIDKMAAAFREKDPSLTPAQAEAMAWASPEGRKIYAEGR